jgi:hypothetical protein
MRSVSSQLVISWMTSSQISAMRFFNQNISGERFRTPKEIVNWLGAVQAQDYNMAKWALGVRLPGSTHEKIEAAINQGDIIRTHVLRPTWHFVSPEDVMWMLELSADNINRIMNSNNRRLGLDEKVFKKCNTLIEKLLRDGNYLTRKEIMAALEKKRIQTNELRSSHIMLRAETDRIVCNGPKKENQFTYALLSEKAVSKKLSKEEALTLLAKKYFQSHGPATLQDFSWWSGLSVADSKIGLENIKDEMHGEEVKENMFWFYPVSPTFKRTSKTVFLPAFDEFLISYKTRNISLAPEFSSKAFTINGIFNPIMVHKSKVIGLWKPELRKALSVNLDFFAKPNDAQKRACMAAGKDFAKFNGLKIGA